MDQKCIFLENEVKQKKLTPMFEWALHMRTLKNLTTGASGAAAVDLEVRTLGQLLLLLPLAVKLASLP